MKTLKISEATHKKLLQEKLDGGHKSIDETIANMIKWYQWWVQPGPGRGPGDGLTVNMHEYRESCKRGKLMKEYQFDDEHK